MRDRPFASGSEPPRPFSEVLGERPEPRKQDLDELPARIEPPPSPFANRRPPR
jgi:hypothetical protein